MSENINKFMLPGHMKGHVIALAGALTLHSGIAAWAMVPSDPVAIPEQALYVTMVAPSSVATEKQESTEPVEKVITPPQPDGLKKVEEKKPVEKKEKVEKKVKAPQVATSGQQSPDAVETRSAQIDPIFNAAYLRNPVPAYPDSARRRGIQGKVLLEVQVRPDGTPAHIEISHSSGFSSLDEAALNAVQNWKFVPARRGSEVVEASVLVPVNFRLN